MIVFLNNCTDSSPQIARQFQQQHPAFAYAMSGKLIGLLPLQTRNLIWSVIFSPDGKYLAIAEGTAGAVLADYPITLWDLSAQKVAVVLRGHKRDIRAIAFSPDGSVLASGGYDSTIRLWNLKEGRETAVLKTHKVVSLAFSPDGKRLASAGDGDKTVKLWDSGTLDEVGTLTVPSQVNKVAFSPDNRTLVVGLKDGSVRFWIAAARLGQLPR